MADEAVEADSESHLLTVLSPEDVIHREGEPHTLGLVLQTADDSSAESDSEDEDFIPTGHVLVCWYPSGKEETLSLKKLTLADRSLLPGDIVRFADLERGSQKGYVKDVSVIADVRVIGTSQIITNIDCKHLEPLQPFLEGTHVTYGSWLGTVKKAFQRVTLRLKNGSRCTLEGAQVNMLYDVSEQRDEDSPFFTEVFYPSQQVAGPARAFKEATWLSGAKPILSSPVVRAVIEQAEVFAVEVNWRVCGACSPGSSEAESLRPPYAMITEDQIPQLKSLQHFHYSSIQIGDKGFYVVKNSDINSEHNVEHQLIGHSSDAREHKTGVQPAAEEAKAADVQVENVSLNVEDNPTGNSGASGSSWKTYWNDVGVKLGNAAEPSDQQVSSFRNSTVEDRKAELTLDLKTARRKTSREDTPVDAETTPTTNSPYARAGHPLETDPAPATDSDDSDPGDGHKPGKRHSDTGLKSQSKRRRKRCRRKRKHAPNLKVSPGDRICVEVVKTQTSVDVIWQDNNCQCNIKSKDLVPVLHLLDELEFFPGDIIVDKRTDSVHPQGAYGVVERADHNARTCNVKWFTQQGKLINIETDVSVYDLDDHPDWSFSPGDVIVRINTDDGSQAEEDGAPKYRPPAGQVIHVTGNGTFLVRWVDGTISEAELQIVYKVNEEDDDGSWETESGMLEEDGEWATTSEESGDEQVNNSMADLIITEPPPTVETPTTPAAEEFAENEIDSEVLENADNLINTALSNTAKEFLLLEAVHDGHHFKSSSFLPQNFRKFAAVVKKEILLLQSSLPPGILVRGFEERMDLGCAMIHGPEGTPYDGGVFCFDICLPPDYPASPPQFHYISFCTGRLNPNLYDDGNVCVSLLGTWTGKLPTETWTNNSNLLQVLLSIQGIILCNEPYFNEAGYERQRQTMQGQENSKLYNEMVLLKLTQSILNMAKKPPEPFTQEIKQYLKQSSPKFIARTQSWIDLSLREPTNEQEAGQLSASSGENMEGAAAQVMASESEHDCSTAQESASSDTGAETQQTTSASCEDPQTCDTDKSFSDNDNKVAGCLKDCEKLSFPLLPLSRGICSSLQRSLDVLREFVNSGGLE